MASAAIHRTPPLQPRRRPGKSRPSSSERPSGVAICSYRRTSVVAVVCLENGFGGCSGDGNFGAMDLIRVFEDDAPMTLASDSKRLFTVGLYMGERSFVDQDKLILRGLKFHGFHGVKQEEKKLGQKFLVDIDAWLDLSKAGKSDDISDTVSYTDIYRIAKDILEGPSQNLLESVAHLIANATLLQFPEISAVRVKVGKPHVAVHGTIDHLGVEILRYNKQHEMAQTK